MTVAGLGKGDMDIFKAPASAPNEPLRCPMCEGKGSLPPPNPGVELRLGEQPSKLTNAEMALVMIHASKLEELAKKMGVNPYGVKVSLDFKDTGHHMCFTIARKNHQTN